MWVHSLFILTATQKRCFQVKNDQMSMCLSLDASSAVTF